jgi:hypothetical protein
MKKIEDYIHLYLGCEVMDLYNNKVGKLVGVSGKDVLVSHNTQWCLAHKEVKPILRPLSSLTGEEIEEMWYGHTGAEVRGEMPNGLTVFFNVTPEHVAYLLSLGIDLFSLIPSGLAIDKTKL